MDETAYRALAATEETGWYYQARRLAVIRLIKHFLCEMQFQNGNGPRLLDIGSGTGGSTAVLQSFGRVVGAEPNALARSLCQTRYPDLQILPCGIETLQQELKASPNLPQVFDVVLILCVLYHRNIDSPSDALAKINQLQPIGSVLVWNEPAYPFLWRQHDRQVFSGRRFYPTEMKKLLNENGYEVLFQSHLLAWAFPIACMLAASDRLRWGKNKETESSAEGSDHRLKFKVTGWFFKILTYAEWSLSFVSFQCAGFLSKRTGLRIPQLNIPFGVSCLVVARKI